MTENMVDVFIGNSKILDRLTILKNEFISKEARLMKITDHDFLSLILTTPSISIFLADDKLTFFEEVQINKIARRLSSGSYFLEKDPVVRAMEFLIKDFELWEDKFLDFIKFVIKTSFKDNSNCNHIFNNSNLTEFNFNETILMYPYLLVNLISTILFGNSEDIFKMHQLKISEFEEVNQVIQKLGLDDMAAFKYLTSTIEVKI